MFSSSNHFSTNCNFLNSVSSSCHEHFKSYDKYLLLNNFTFKGASFLQIFWTMCFTWFFFSESTWIGNLSPSFLLREWFYLIEKWFHSPSLSPQKLKSQGRSHLPLESGRSKGKWFLERQIGIRPSVLSQSSRKTRSSAQLLSDQNCTSVFYQKVIWGSSLVV